jgi:flagellar capping protein FliD
MNLVGTRAGTGENETDPERGLITGDTMLMRIRNKMSTLVVNAYPTSEAPAISTLGHIGISTGVHGSLWENISSGLLTVEEEKFTDAFVHHPEAVAELFGNDTDNDYLTDSGVAFAMDRVLKEVTTRARGLIALRQDTTDTQLKQNGRQIDDWKQHLEEYEKKLRRDFTTMEGRVNEMEHTQDWIQQQTERKGQ